MRPAGTLPPSKVRLAVRRWAGDNEDRPGWVTFLRDRSELLLFVGPVHDSVEDAAAASESVARWAKENGVVDW